MANQNIGWLNYTFFFDAVETFQHAFQFEKALQEFFAAKEIEAEFINPMQGAASSERVVFLKAKPKDLIVGPDKRPVGRPQTLKGKIKDLSDRKLRKPAIEFMKGTK